MMNTWKEESDALIQRLLKIPTCLIHRDFQSQNIMLRDNRRVFIDLQGMRPDNLFYDMGSLICDSHVTFTEEERNELIAFYSGLWNQTTASINSPITSGKRGTAVDTGSWRLWIAGAQKKQRGFFQAYNPQH